MLKWALVSFIVSLIAGLLAFAGMVAGAGAIVEIVFFIFVVLFVAFLVLGVTIPGDGS
ncbi:MAG TPA: DUF1328 domain-containing protein [Burkholderiales bacterium]|nr:DUF1328 domain-containing protein [Burkholderiales bacterium]